MKLNQNILPTISSAVDLNVSGSWISSFNLSKHPGERGYMAWIDWQSSITRAYQTPVCNYPGSVWQWDLICAGIIVTKMCVERGTALHLDPSIIFISMFSPANSLAQLIVGAMVCSNTIFSFLIQIPIPELAYRPIPNTSLIPNTDLIPVRIILY